MLFGWWYNVNEEELYEMEKSLIVLVRVSSKRDQAAQASEQGSRSMEKGHNLLPTLLKQKSIGKRILQQSNTVIHSHAKWTQIS